MKYKERRSGFQYRMVKDRRNSDDPNFKGNERRSGIERRQGTNRRHIEESRDD